MAIEKTAAEKQLHTRGRGKFSAEDRLRWIRMYQDGATVREICETCGVSRSIFYYAWAKYQEDPQGYLDDLAATCSLPVTMGRVGTKMLQCDVDARTWSLFRRLYTLYAAREDVRVATENDLMDLVVQEYGLAHDPELFYELFGTVPAEGV